MTNTHYQCVNYQLYCQITTREGVLTHVHLFSLYFTNPMCKYITFLANMLPSNRVAHPLWGWFPPHWEILEPPPHHVHGLRTVVDPGFGGGLHNMRRCFWSFFSYKNISVNCFNNFSAISSISWKFSKTKW